MTLFSDETRVMTLIYLVRLDVSDPSFRASSYALLSRQQRFRRTASNEELLVTTGMVYIWRLAREVTENNNGIFWRNPNWRVYLIGRTAKMALKALIDTKDVLLLTGLIKSLIYQLAQLVVALSYCCFDWSKLGRDRRWESGGLSNHLPSMFGRVCSYSKTSSQIALCINW